MECATPEKKKLTESVVRWRGKEADPTPEEKKLAESVVSRRRKWSELPRKRRSLLNPW